MINLGFKPTRRALPWSFHRRRVGTVLLTSNAIIESLQLWLTLRNGCAACYLTTKRSQGDALRLGTVIRALEGATPRQNL